MEKGEDPGRRGGHQGGLTLPLEPVFNLIPSSWSGTKVYPNVLDLITSRDFPSCVTPLSPRVDSSWTQASLGHHFFPQVRTVCKLPPTGHSLAP